MVEEECGLLKRHQPLLTLTLTPSASASAFEEDTHEVIENWVDVKERKNEERGCDIESPKCEELIKYEEE